MFRFFNSRPDVSGSTRSVYPGWTEQVFTVHFTLRSAVYLLYQELTDSCCCTPADASLFLFTHQCCNHSPKWKQVKLHTLKNTFSVHHIQTGGDQFFTMPQRNCLKYDLSPPRPPSRPPRPSQPPPLCHSWLLRLSTAVISLSAQLCWGRHWWGVRGRAERAPIKLDLFTYRGAALCSAARGLRRRQSRVNFSVCRSQSCVPQFSCTPNYPKSSGYLPLTRWVTVFVLDVNVRLF